MNKQNPQCVGFIMDGNRRFARMHGKPDLAGHAAGKETFLEVIRWTEEVHIPHVIFYTFSTENWHRSQAEVEGLMTLFKEVITSVGKDAQKRSFRLRFVGRRQDFSLEFQEDMNRLERETEQSEAASTVWLALSYGGRAEIVDAVNAAIAKGEVVDEAGFAKLLYTAEMPDPDLIIRTGGEQRLSNFLPWQSVYSELFFTDTYWPAFTKEEFTRILNAYAERERRIGT